MRTKKRTSGRVLAVKWACVVALAGVFAGSASMDAWAAEKKPKAAESLGVIAGSVFRETGFSFAGVEIVVVWEVDGKKKKEWKGRSDARGEFAFRVPAGVGRYTVHVKAEGHAPEERAVEIGIDERRELSIRLQTETVKR
jgi:hypothetical protein